MNDELMEEAILFLNQFKNESEKIERAEGKAIIVRSCSYQDFRIEFRNPVTESLGFCDVYKDGVLLRHFGKDEICTPIEIYGVIGGGGRL